MFNVKIQLKKTMVVICLGMLPALSLADSSTQQNSPAQQALLAQEQSVVPKNMISNAIMHPGQSAETRALLAKLSQSAAASESSSTSSQDSQQPAGGNASFGASGVSQAAFANMIKSLMPLSPQQILTLRKLFDQSQRTIAQYPGTPPKPTSSSVIVNLSPGAAPPIIRLRAGFITSLVFIDSTGQSWPIQAYDIGDPNSFNVQWDQKGNTLLVQSTSAYKSGNLAVILKGQDTPVMITLMPGQRAVDYRVDLRMPGLGPNAEPMMSNLAATSNPKLLDFLNGVPPNSAKALQVEGAPCQAWLLGGHMYLRTQLSVLSPSWLSSMSSPDGTHVYELNKAPVVLASFRGQVTQLTIQGL